METLKNVLFISAILLFVAGFAWIGFSIHPGLGAIVIAIAIIAGLFLSEI